MKSIYNVLNLRSLIVILSLFAFSSCSEDFPGNIESTHEVVLKSIKILNAGADGNTVLEGVVDENKKTVSFPRIDPSTDLSAIRFEAETSQGASLDQESYKAAFEEGVSEKVIIVKVMNEPRYREYLVTLRLKVPVFGADFTNATVYDYSNNELGNPTYASFTGSMVRGSGFNGKYVLVVDRGNGVTPHVLEVDKLKDNIIKPIYLNPGAGLKDGTFAVHSGAIVGDHIYVASLSGSNVSPLKIYHWTDPAQPAEVILNTTTGAPTGGSYRFGDNMSVNIDQNGNGTIYFVDNGGIRVLYYKVTNFTTISDPVFFPTAFANVGSWGSYNRIGNSAEYIYTGHQAPIRLVGGSGNLIYEADKKTYPERLSDVRVITFNGERYLIGITAARGSGEPTLLNVYNITRGETIAEALQMFDASGESFVYNYSLSGPDNINPASQTGWFVKKDSEGNDDVLMLYAATVNAGFAFIEFPRKQPED